MSTQNNTIRVLAWPAYSNKDGNPYNYLLYSAISQVDNRVSITEFRLRRTLQARYDILHIHWPETIFNSPRPGYAVFISLVWLILIPLLKMRGTKLVWTAHNLREHEVHRPVLSKFMWFWFVRRVDGLIVLSESSRKSIYKLNPKLANVPTLHTPHGNYRDVYPRTITRKQARQKLGLPEDATVIGFVGAIRSYKNVPHLINTFNKAAGKNWHLVIAGKVSDADLEQEIRAHASPHNHIHLHLTFVPDSELQTYFLASDLMVFPYRDILNSGSALLSLSFNCPVLVPALGSMRELQDDIGMPWVSTYSDELNPEHLQTAVIAARASVPSDDIMGPEYHWEDIAIKTIKFFRNLAGPMR